MILPALRVASEDWMLEEDAGRFHLWTWTWLPVEGPQVATSPL